MNILRLLNIDLNYRPMRGLRIARTAGEFHSSTAYLDDEVLVTQESRGLGCLCPPQRPPKTSSDDKLLILLAFSDPRMNSEVQFKCIILFNKSCKLDRLIETSGTWGGQIENSARAWINLFKVLNTRFVSLIKNPRSRHLAKPWL